MAALPPSLSSFDLEPEVRDALFGSRAGLSLVSGRAGSSKSALAKSIAGAALSGEATYPDVSPVKAVAISPLADYDLEACERNGSRVLRISKGEERLNDLLVHAMKIHADLILVDPVTRAESLMHCAHAGSVGHRTVAVVNGSDVADVLNWGALAASFVEPGTHKIDNTLDFVGSLNLVVAQRMLPKVGGGTVSCREWLVVDPEIRAMLSGEDNSRWDEVFRYVADNLPGKARTFERSAELLLERGMVDRATFEGAAGLAAAA